MKRQAGLSLVLAMLLVGLSCSVANAAYTPTASPLAPINRNARCGTDKQALDARKAAARVARAAICTEDLSQIKFQEYYVDWSTWMSEVGDRWSIVFNSAYNNGKFRTDGAAFVQFTCKRDGTISDVLMEKSSGDRLCDRGQMEALVSCMPLPAFPVGSAKDSVTMLYVWEYGRKVRIAKPVKAVPRAHSNNVQRITITGKLM